MCLCLNGDEIRKNAVKLEVNKRCRQVGHGTIGLREQLPMVIWPLVGFKKWHKDARDGKQAKAHNPESYSRDVGRDECGTGREGSSAVHGQLY